MSTEFVTPRRAALLGLLASGLVCAIPRGARAGAALPVPLNELISRSRLSLVGTARQASSVWEGSGGGRRIVTYSRVEVHQRLDGQSVSTSELFVRTLGGAVGELAQAVHGEAQLELGKPAVFFLRDLAIAPEGSDAAVGDVFVITAMAQGHYPLLKDNEGTDRLTLSPKLGDFLRADPHCAVNKLRGKSVADAERLVLAARATEAGGR